ncbi:hypothetical protein [Glutamicibacter sp. JC586]|uniref:hypothetical protein n=1 Tax=Glutamicibacter sp. JC586 TaxID=2590552 RepID=UPI0013587DED|nr:hypothetical protein [Glutamicibacter sp. JC586]
MSKRKVPGESFSYGPLPVEVQNAPGLSGDDDLRLTVDGEIFSVRSTSHASVHYTWISGLNDGYGFSALGTDQAPTVEQHEAVIREFLADINPATGFLQD